MSENFDLGNSLTVFGNKGENFAYFQNRYPGILFHRIKQVHGNQIVKAGEGVPSADAHWTERPLTALCINTADCLPVMFLSLSRPLIAAAHAGWRGIECGILGKTVDTFKHHGVDPRFIFALIGPFIQKPSFEVGEDVANRLQQVHSTLDGEKLSQIITPTPEKSGKFQVDLGSLARIQLLNCDLKPENIKVSTINTYESENYNSYRRDGDKAGRQISFVFFR